MSLNKRSAYIGTMNPLSRRTWTETLHLLLDLLVGTVGFSLVVVGLATGAGLLITFVGIPVLAATLLLSRAGARVELWRAATLLGVELHLPHPIRRRDTLLARVLAPLSDGASWRAAVYFVMLLPVGIVTFSVAVTLWATALGFLTLPAWAWALPGGGPELGNGSHWSEPWQLAVLSGAGLALVFAAPFVIHALTYLDRGLLQLLRRPRSEQRIETLEETRARSVDAAVQERRRIERDLHDGAQQRIVALGLDLGLALEKFDEEPDAARDLVGGAHREAQTAIAELRDLVRGFAPAVLEDRGLDAALSALAARSSVPVQITVDLPTRLPASIEANAYFIVAEALTNVARHARATAAQVEVEEVDGCLRIEISDDGQGGADPSRGTGLAGLAARAAAVDGSFVVDSPPGGGTRLVAELPCAS
jgi:signal transduction histidine kinase